MSNVFYDSVSPAVDMDFSVQPADIGSDSAHAQIQIRCNLFVRPARGQQFQHIPLPWGEELRPTCFTWNCNGTLLHGNIC